MCVCLLFVTAHWGVENLHKNASTMHAMASNITAMITRPPGFQLSLTTISIIKVVR